MYDEFDASGNNAFQVARMGKRLVFLGPRSVGFEQYPEPQLGVNEIRVETLYSGISHGTEMNVYRGTAPFFQKRWNAKYGVFLKETSSWQYPITYGYEEVCRVVEIGGVKGHLHSGDLICSAYGHQSTGILHKRGLKTESFPLNGSIIPRGIDPIVGVFHLVANVVLNGVHKAGVKLGDQIAVFGLGVMGLLAVQLSKQSGADHVIAVDLIDERLKLAEKLGADVILNPGTEDAALEIKKITHGGTDIAFESSGSVKALHEAIRSCRYGSKVVAIGWYQKGATDLLLGEEFHHNDISIVCARAGPPPAPERDWDCVRLSETFFRLVSKGRLKVKELITHEFPFDEAPKAYRLIDENPEQVIKCVLRFNS